ncbi:winged helix-turn-helix domain-containing protein [Streptomyces sp. NPDC027717]|uniref:GntR family transcriptional regulator n=1 Tax=Streptomyces sp. NPDC027717 TaxID=3155765 RepID=UPI0033C04779
MSQASPRGTYLQVSESLRRQIESGDVGIILPSEANLVRSFGVSRNTVRRALKLLEADGVVESAPGVGWRRAQSGDGRSLAIRMMEVITEDSLSVGDTYPSEAKLCERFGVSRTTVRRVLAQMEGNGLLVTVHGKGRTVRALPSSATQP